MVAFTCCGPKSCSTLHNTVLKATPFTCEVPGATEIARGGDLDGVKVTGISITLTPSLASTSRFAEVHSAERQPTLTLKPICRACFKLTSQTQSKGEFRQVNSG